MNTVDKRKILKIGLLIAAAIPVIIISIVFIRACCLLQSKKELQNIRNATATIVLSQEDKLIGKIFTENRTNISYEQIPEDLIHALVATEDARFYNHNGVDSRSLFRVFFKTILLNRQSAGGGSTITQQLAKNLFGRNIKGPFKLLTIKTKETLLARRLEKIFTKEEILTLYFNTVPFGENIYGIEAAAQRYFNKKTDQLKMEESAMLIGMLKANHVYNPRLHPENAKSRRNVVFKQMQKYDYLDSATVDSLSRLPLQLDYSNLERNGPADYFLYQVKKEAREILQNVESASGKKWNIEEDGLIIKTTLNLDIQNFANQSFRDHLSTMQYLLEKQYKSKAGRKFIENLAETELKKQNLTENASVTDSIRKSIQLLHAGLLAMDPVTGAVRAWVGGIDFKTHPYDQILARRQMGSTLKPVLFAAALEMGYSPCKYLDNDSLVITGYEDWKPRNFDHSYGGKYSLTGALVHSMNIPAVNLFLEMGFSSLDSLWRRMGFSFALDNTPSLALGTAEASIQEVAVAYSVFANGGFRITPQKIVSIQSHDGQMIWQNELMEEKVSVLSERTSLLMNAMLRNAVRAGTGTPLRSRYGVELPVAGKTGTTQDYSDAWFAAYCPSLVVVSRVGASLPSVRFNTSSYGTGSTLALPLVALTLKKIQDSPRLSKRFIAPFPLPDPELERQMDCPDFKETDLLDDILDFLKRKEIDQDKSGKRPERKRRPLFRRLRW